MLHSTAIDVSLLWGEGQTGELVEGEISVGVGGAETYSLCQVLIVPGPPDSDRCRVEPADMADEGVLHPQVHIVPGVDAAVRRVYGNTFNIHTSWLCCHRFGLKHCSICIRSHDISL